MGVLFQQPAPLARQPDLKFGLVSLAQPLDPLPTDQVFTVINNPQVGQQVLYFRPVIEANPAHQFVINFSPNQRFFNCP